MNATSSQKMWESYDQKQIEEELLKCSASPLYFIQTYCYIYDAADGGWIPFLLWRPQRIALQKIHDNDWTIALKARQLGITWLVLCYFLWLMLFRAIASVLLFSRRDEEAVYLLGEERFKGVYKRLPTWMQCEKIIESNAHLFRLSNGSSARAFPSNAGDSYTATAVMLDEADLIPNFNTLMKSVKPTIDAGGKIVLVSRTDKSKPMSPFKQTYRDAVRGKNGWAWVFLPWFTRPERTQEWYENVKSDIQTRTGSLDDLHEQYPATADEALAPRTLDKRIPYTWVMACREDDAEPITTPQALADIPGLRIYKDVEPNRSYALGMDPAEGNPNSDDSACTILCRETGEEIGNLAGKIEISQFASYCNRIGLYYSKATAMIERNNHGHAVILWFESFGDLEVQLGTDEKKGWLNNSLGKSTMYGDLADAFRDGNTLIRDPDSFNQIVSLEGSTLRAPENEFDDRSDSYALAFEGVLIGKPAMAPFTLDFAW